MRNFRRFCFLCLFVQIFLPFVSAYAQPSPEARAALEKLKKYRTEGDAGDLKSALASVDSLMLRLEGSIKDPGFETLSAAAAAAETAYQATGDEKYLAFAEKLAASIIEKLNTGPVSSGQDGSMAVHVLMDLYHITGIKAYKQEALKAVKGLPQDSPAAKECRETAYEFIIVGRLGSPGTDELIKKSFMFEDPGRVVVILDPSRNKKRLDQLGYEYPGKSTLFVCSEKTCFPPVYSGEDLARIKQTIKKLRETK